MKGESAATSDVFQGYLMHVKKQNTVEASVFCYMYNKIPKVPVAAGAVKITV